jgi:dTDP-glucose 4,6-dehydratase/UDP-glucose 4,6-dehydratase
MVPRYPNANFFNYDSLNYCANLKNVDVGYYPNYKFIFGKLQDKEALLKFMQSHQIDCVVHFAAQSHVDTSFNESLVFTDDNIFATHVLLECCRLCGPFQIKRFIHISTDEVYGDSTIGNPECKTESSKLHPTNPYAATKAAAEMLCISYLYSFGIPIIITRSNNVYGPGQYKEKLIPKFITLLLENQKCTIHGNGEFLRSFIHTYDLCTAIEVLLFTGVIGETYNIGSSDEYTVNQIADTLIYHLKNTSQVEDWKVHVEDRVFNDTRYLISSDKLKALGWNQTVPFNEGLQNTIRWYMENINRMYA